MDFGLGVGWASTFHRQVQVIDSEAFILRRGDGQGEPIFCDAFQCTTDPDSDFIATPDNGGIIITDPDGREEHYDAAGFLTQDVDTFGKATTYLYDVDGNLESVTGPFGHQIGFTYLNGHLVTMTDPKGEVFTYTYTGENLTQVEYPDSTTREYHYELSELPHHLTGITDENGVRFATFAYDDGGRAISSEHAVTTNGQPQEKVTLAYDSDVQTTITDAKGNAETRIYETHLNVKRLATRNLADANTITQMFEANGNVLKRTDEKGRVTQHTYNADNQRTSTTEAFGRQRARTTTFEYVSPDVDLVERKLEPSVFSTGQVETLTDYGPNNEVRSITVNGFTPDGTSVSRTTAFEYYSAADGVQFVIGKLKSVDGPRTDESDVTLFEYFDCATGGKCGQLKKITNPLGHVTRFLRYDLNGRSLKMRNANGVKTTRKYDTRGRLRWRRETLPDGTRRVTKLFYDNVGQLRRIVDPDGRAIVHTYDAAHDRKSTRDDLYNRIKFRYDLNGNLRKETTVDPATQSATRVLSRTFDVRNRVRSVNHGGSRTRFGYDGVGNRTRVIDPNKYRTTSRYDVLNRLKRTIDPLQGNTDFLFDIGDRLISVQDPRGVTTAFTYDDLGNLLQEDSPDRGLMTHVYDAAGNRIGTTDARGIAATFAYDALNRLTAIHYPNPAEDVDFEYDQGVNGIGRLTRITDEAGSIDLVYDGFGNLASRSEERRGKV